MSLAEDLCGRFCSYYKPGKNENLACRGFTVLERMVSEGKRISFDRTDRPVCGDAAAALDRFLCRRCPFYEADCDFAAKVEAPPCGGYLLLGQLLQAHVISVDDLEDGD